MNDAALIESLGELFADIFNVEPPGADTDLFEHGLLDSLQFVELLGSIEQRFGTRMQIEEFDLDDLRTLARIARLVAAKASATTAPDPAASVPR